MSTAPIPYFHDCGRSYQSRVWLPYNGQIAGFSTITNAHITPYLADTTRYANDFGTNNRDHAALCMVDDGTHGERIYDLSLGGGGTYDGSTDFAAFYAWGKDGSDQGLVYTTTYHFARDVYNVTADAKLWMIGSVPGSGPIIQRYTDGLVPVGGPVAYANSATGMGRLAQVSNGTVNQVWIVDAQNTRILRYNFDMTTGSALSILGNATGGIETINDEVWVVEPDFDLIARFHFDGTRLSPDYAAHGAFILTRVGSQMWGAHQLGSNGVTVFNFDGSVAATGPADQTTWGSGIAPGRMAVFAG